MVSPCKTVHAKSKPEATKTSKLIEKYVFYLDIKNSAESKLIESKIKKLGGLKYINDTCTFMLEEHVAFCKRVEVFLVDSVTHVVSDAAPCAARPLPVPPSTNSPAPHTWGGRRRADAMLERAALLQPPCRPSAAPVPLLPSNVPVWSVPKVKEFLSRLWSAAYKKLHTEERALQEPFIKFEAIDRKSRAVYKELGAWPELQLKGAHSGCPFMSPGEARASKGPAAKARNIPSSATRKRMTRKTKPRPKEQVDVPLKQSGYCEICRVEYDHLADHERSVSHLSFVKNCSNFLSLDSLISANADVEAFLKMNKPVTVANNSLERRSLRNIIKSHQDETQDPRKQLEVICNGAEPHSPHTPCTSPALGHYLRSKGGPEQDYPPKVSPQGLLNGSASPPRLNGKIEAESRKLPQTTNRSIRWRRPSPEGTPPIRDTQTYYRVVGMSTKLRSSNNFTPAPTPTSNRAPPGLVVKFRRVRRSELSVLSDEAENFMFPKKDDSDTEDEVETTPSSRKRPSSALLSESPVKEEVMSGDEEWDAGRRNPRRQAHIESYRDSIEAEPPLEPEPPGTPAPLGAEGPPPAAPEPEVEGETKQRCLKWEEGRLRASEEVERLTYTFEQVPHSEPWYHTFRRQDEGKENTKSIINYLGYYSKSLVLPYEMSEIPPLKPNCCALSQVKRPSDAKSRPPRSYGTRGMKKMRKIKPADPVFTFNSTSLSRKSPREHASTLAILGGLIHRKSKFSCSDDSKSLPSIAEEDCSSDTTPYTPAPLPPCDAEISMQIDALLSSVYEGEEDFEVPVEAEDCGVKLDHTSVKPDVIQLLQDFEECDILDNTVREIHENVQPEAPKRRRGYKFKKKNRTGWPNKKKLKRDPPSTVGSASSSREPSREPSQHRPPQEDSAPKDNGHVELNENSITWSDTEEIETASVSSKYTEASEELPLQMPTCSVPPVQEWDRDRDLQPVVRVLKMEAKLERRLRSADVNRRLRARRRPARPHR